MKVRVLMRCIGHEKAGKNGDQLGKEIELQAGQVYDLADKEAHHFLAEKLAVQVK